MSSDAPTAANEFRFCGVGAGEALRWNGSRGIFFNSDYFDTSGNKEREKEGDRGIRSEGQREIEKKSRSSRTYLLITYKACCEQGFQLRHPPVGLRSELSMLVDVDRAGLNFPSGNAGTSWVWYDKSVCNRTTILLFCGELCGCGFSHRVFMYAIE